MNKILVAGPFLGELGWEVFSFEPIVYGEFLKGDYDKLIVYASPGRTLLYGKDAEIRDFDFPEGLEAACNSTMFIPEQVEIHKQLLKTIDEQLAKEFPEDNNIIQRIHGLSLPRCDPMLDIGLPTKLEPDEWFPLGLIREKKTICLCIRDREFSDFRNWGYENWTLLVSELEFGHNVVIIGNIRNEREWYELSYELLVSTLTTYDMTNRTAVDDCISIFQQCDLVVGGSSGTMHLASRCGIPHLVWGYESNTKRYKETNYFDTPHKVYEWGWHPEVDQVADAIKHYLRTGAFQ